MIIRGVLLPRNSELTEFPGNHTENTQKYSESWPKDTDDDDEVDNGGDHGDDDHGSLDYDEYTSSVLDSVLEVAVAVFNMQVTMFVCVWLT